MKINNPQAFRQNVLQKLDNLIGDKTVSLNLERGIYNYAIRKAKECQVVRKWDNHYFVTLYMDRLRSLYVNLDNKSPVRNSTLMGRLRKKEFKAHELAFMSHQEMFPEKWQDLVDAKIKRDRNAAHGEDKGATDEFKCWKCKKRKCTYYQLQTRSADEPVTTFVQCLVCANRWRC